MRAHRLVGDRYQAQPELRGEDILRSPVLPGFEAVVATFFPPTGEVDG